MEIATGYFISRAPAIEAARTLSKHGMRIEVLGYQNDEDFRERQIANQYKNDLDLPYYGFMGGNAGISSGINGFFIAGSGPVIGVRPIVSLVNAGIGGEFREIMIDWGVPREVEQEIRSVVDAGNSVVLVECQSDKKSVVREILEKHGAQNIHI